jgi:quercetin dioxygenase-like cupin family protein
MLARPPCRSLLIVLSVAAVHTAAAEGEVIEKGVTHRPVAAESLPNISDHSLTALVVDFEPGGLSPSHRHPGFVFAYVWSPSRIMRVLGSGHEP